MATYEEQMEELEKIVARLEAGDLPLEESVSLFERGTMLSRACRGELERAESRIQVLDDPQLDGPVRTSEYEPPEDEEDDEADEEDE